MTDQRQPSEDSMFALDDLFAEARDIGRASMPETLVDRIAQDAMIARRAPVRVSLWARFEEALGGWPSLGGLATAALAGLYVGFADPTLATTVGFASTDITEVTIDLLPGDDVFFDTVLGEEG